MAPHGRSKLHFRDNAAHLLLSFTDVCVPSSVSGPRVSSAVRVLTVACGAFLVFVDRRPHTRVSQVLSPQRVACCLIFLMLFLVERKVFVLTRSSLAIESLVSDTPSPGSSPGRWAFTRPLQAASPTLARRWDCEGAGGWLSRSLSQKSPGQGSPWREEERTVWHSLQLLFRAKKISSQARFLKAYCLIAAF